MRFLFLSGILACLLSAQGTWQLRRWNDQAPNTGPGVKSLDFTRGVATLLPMDHGGFLYSEEVGSQIREAFTDGRIVRRLGTDFRGGELAPLETQNAPTIARYFCLDGTGALWFAGGNQVRRMTADGVIAVIGESKNATPPFDASQFVSAAARRLSDTAFQVEGIACSDSSEAYFTDAWTSSVIRLGSDGFARRFAGVGRQGPDPNNPGVRNPALQHHFENPQNLVRAGDLLFVYDRSRVHRLELSAGLAQVILIYEDPSFAGSYPHQFGLGVDGASLLVGEPDFRVGAIPLNTQSLIRVFRNLPTVAFDFSKERMDVSAFGRLRDGSYVIGTRRPGANIFRSLNGTWIPVIGSAVKEERVPLSLLFNSYFEGTRWTSDGEMLFQLHHLPAALNLAGYRQGDDFVTLYSGIAPDSSYFYVNPPGNFLTRNGRGDWVYGNFGSPEVYVWRAATKSTTKHYPAFPPPFVLPGTASFADDNSIWITQSGDVFRYDLSSAAMFPLTKVRDVERPKEGPLGQSNTSGFPPAFDSTGQLTFFHPTERAGDAAIWRADLRSRTLSRITGTPSSPPGRHGMVAKDAKVFGITAMGCAASGLVFHDLDFEGLRFVNRQGILEDVLRRGGATASDFLGDALRNGFAPHSYFCWPDGSIVASGFVDRVIRDVHPPNYTRLRKRAGDDQELLQPGPLRSALEVEVTRSNQPVANQLVRFRIFRGAGELSQSQVFTDGQGLARVSLRLPSAPGPVWVEASIETGATVMFRALLRYPARPLPVLSSSSVVGAALSVPAVNRLSASGIATIFGANFADAPRAITSADIRQGELPTSLGGICVELNGRRAPLFAVFPAQINFQVPAIPPGGSVDLRVIAGCDTPSAGYSASVSVPVASATPEFFYSAYAPGGAAPVIAVDAMTGELAPLRAGQWITLYATGLGPVSPSVSPGRVATAAASLSLPYSIQIGGNTVDASRIAYAGVAPGTAGQYQINLKLPDELPVGRVPIRLNVGGTLSPSGPYLEIEAK